MEIQDIDFEQLYQKVWEEAQEYDTWLTASQIHNIFGSIFTDKDHPGWRLLWDIVEIMVDLGMIECRKREILKLYRPIDPMILCLPQQSQ